MIGDNATDQARACIAAGRRHSVAVAAGGVVLTAERGSSGERDVAGWSDIVAVAAGNVHTASNTGRSHTVGLRGDGTVVAVGWNTDGQCDTDGWTNVVTVAASWRRTVAVRADGGVARSIRHLSHEARSGTERPALDVPGRFGLLVKQGSRCGNTH